VLISVKGERLQAPRSDLLEGVSVADFWDSISCSIGSLRLSVILAPKFGLTGDLSIPSCPSKSDSDFGLFKTC